MATKSNTLISSVLRQLRPRTQRVHPFQTFAKRLAPVSYPQPLSVRAAHSIPRPPPRKPSPKAQAELDSQENLSQEITGEGERPELKAAYYQLSFTCVPCSYRSHHNVSKQGYHKGSVLITCPSCRNRHVISDHLNIFGDKKMTVEDLMRKKGELVKRGSLGEDGDIEFWPDERYAQQEDEAAAKQVGSS